MTRKISVNSKVRTSDKKVGKVTKYDEKNKLYGVVVKTQGLFEILWRPANRLEVRRD